MGSPIPTLTLTPSPSPSPTPSPTSTPLPTPTPTPAGLAVDETNFPDEAFREYVSTYVDTDGDGRLSQEERDAVTWIGNYPYADAWWRLDEIKYKKKIKKEARELIGEVRSFAGIEYFENLEEIRLIEYGAYVTNVEKLSLCNPKLRVCNISFNSENTTETDTGETPELM